MATLQCTTELEAVNSIIGTIGDSPISSLEVSNSVSAETAKFVLNEISRDVQMTGWHFNTDVDYPITPDVDGYLQVAVNVLKIDPTKEYPDYDLAQRGSRMYDRKEHTYVFTETIEFNVVWFLAFTDLPEAARRYITIRAARVFADRQLSSEVIHGFTENDEIMARAQFLEADADNADYNIFNSYSVMRVLDRKI